MANYVVRPLTDDMRAKLEAFVADLTATMEALRARHAEVVHEMGDHSINECDLGVYQRWLEEGSYEVREEEPVAAP